MRHPACAGREDREGDDDNDNDNEAWERSGWPWGIVRNRRANAGVGGKRQEPDGCVDAGDSDDEEYAIAQNREWLTRMQMGK